MSSRVPISSTNVETRIGIEVVPGVVATLGKWVAYDQNGLVPNQAQEKNVELRGNRQMGTRVPGMKAPGGTFMQHQTDLVLPLSWYATLGAIASVVQPQTAPVATLAPTAAGNVNNGAHSYKRVITRPGGTAASGVSNSITIADKTVSGKITLAFGALPAGWTSALYRSAAGNNVTGPWVLVPGTATLAATVTSFVDNVADASLSGAYPSITNDDQKHTITPGLTLPSLTIEKKLPYLGDTAEYFQSLGNSANKATAKFIGAGFYDISLDYLGFDYEGPFTDPFDPSALDWRGGEKIHHAMALAGDVLVDGVAFGKFIDLTIVHSNNLDTTDHPFGLQGGLDSLAPQQAETQATGTVKVTDPAVVALARDTTILHTISAKHTFVTPGHYIKHTINGISFDPSAPAPNGQGIMKYSANGIASQPDGGDQIVIECVNDQPIAAYTT